MTDIKNDSGKKSSKLKSQKLTPAEKLVRNAKRAKKGRAKTKYLEDTEIDTMRKAVRLQLVKTGPKIHDVKLGKTECKHANRNSCMFEIALGTGLRIAEVNSIDYGQVATVHGKIRDQLEMDREHLKGRSDDRVLAITSTAKEAIARYIKDQDFAFKQSDPLFFSDRSVGKLTDAPQLLRFKTSGMMNLYRSYFYASGLKPPGQKGIYSSHCFRKTYAKEVWDITKDINKVSHMLGHHSVKATQAYMPVILQTEKDALAHEMDKRRRERETAAAAAAKSTAVAAVAPPETLPRKSKRKKPEPPVVQPARVISPIMKRKKRRVS